MKLTELTWGEMGATLLTLLLVCIAYSTVTPPAYAETIKLTSDPDCVSVSQDRIDCVARATDNALWHNSWVSGSWSGWESFGGKLSSGPSITSWGPGRLDMFVKGPDNALWHIWRDGTLHPWESIGGVITSDPDCTSPGLNMIDCFARGPDNALWHTALNGGSWSGWKSVGGVLASGPGAASALVNSGKMLLLFVKSVDNAMWQIDYDGKWFAWEKRGGILTSDPDAVTSYDPQNPKDKDRFDIVVRGPGNGIFWKWWLENVGWSTGCQGCDGYETLGGPSNEQSNSGPTIASRGWNSLDVFALGTDNNLYHRGWDGSNWSLWDAVPMTLALTVTSITMSSSQATTSSESSTTSSVSTVNQSTQPLSDTVTITPVASNITDIVQQNPLIVLIVVVLTLLAVLALRRRPSGPTSVAQPSAKLVYCRKCGNQNPTTNQFCGKCGVKLG